MSEIVPRSVGPTGPGDPTGPGRGAGPEIGFGGSNPIAAGLLARYLVGRVVAARLSVSLMITALVILAGAVALWVWGPHWLAVLVGLIALAVVAFRALVMAILLRVMGVGRLGPVEDKIRALVGDTEGDLRRELHRIGLPATLLGMPFLIFRFLGRRRAETLTRLHEFDVNRVVPRSRQDELQFLVSNHLTNPR